MFIFYSNRKGLVKSLVISLVGSAILIALLLLLNH